MSCPRSSGHSGVIGRRGKVRKTRPTIPHKRSPPESSISDDDTESDAGMQTEPEVAASKSNPIAPAVGLLTHAGSEAQ
jgi:hypothetical protein